MTDDGKRAEYSYPPRYMRAKRAAAYLDVSRSQFLRWVEEEVLPQPVKRGGVVVWDRHDLDAAMEDLKEEKINSVDRALEKLRAKK